MIKFISVTFFIIWGMTLMGQTPISWAELADVEITHKMDSTNFISYNEAKFGETVKSLDSTSVALKGYLIPIDAMGLTYALSRNPNSSCFFCGGAGPETVVLLHINPKYYKRYKTDTRLTFKGTLQLNDNDQNSFIYVLKNAEEN